MTQVFTTPTTKAAFVEMIRVFHTSHSGKKLDAIKSILRSMMCEHGYIQIEDSVYYFNDIDYVMYKGKEARCSCYKPFVAHVETIEEKVAKLSERYQKEIYPTVIENWNKNHR